MFRNTSSLTVSSMPVLDHIKHVFQSEFGRDFSKLPNRDSTLFVIIQHGFISIRPMMDIFLEMGIPPNHVFMTTKPHTTSSNMLEYFQNGFEHYTPFKWKESKTTFSQTNIEKSRYKMLTGVTHHALFDSFCDYLFRYPSPENIKNIIICDEGGKFLSEFIERYHHPDTEKYDKKLSDYHVVAIEHTKCGTYGEALGHLPFPLINMADSYLKTRIESEFIAESMFVNLEDILQRIILNSPTTIIGIVGGGNIGEEVLGFLVKKHPDIVMIVYDIKPNVLSASTIATKEWRNVSRESSIEALFQQANIILGCTGVDFMKGRSYECFLTNQSSEIHLISCSSGDAEFYTLLQNMPGYQFESLKDIRDYTRTLNSEGSQKLTIYNGGFPMNFLVEQPKAEPAPESVPENRIQITRSMKLAAIVQALKLLEVMLYFSNKRSLRGYLQLDIAYQWEIIQSFYHDLIKEQSLEKQAIIQQKYSTITKENIAQGSVGALQPTMNSVLKTPHYITTRYQVRMEEQLLRQESPIKYLAIHGTAGSGKTTLAQHFLQKQRLLNPTYLHRVLLGETLTQWWDSLRKWAEELAPELNTLLRATRNPQKQEHLIIEHLQKALQKTPWCIVIDNWDQKNVETGEIASLFLSIDGDIAPGTLVITTQGPSPYGTISSLDLSGGFAPEESQKLLIKVMNLEEELSITWKDLGSVTELDSLVMSLNHLPLAIILAGSYLMWENKARRLNGQPLFKFQDYITLLDQKVSELMQVYDQELGGRWLMPRDPLRQEFKRLKTQEAAVDLSLKKAIQIESSSPNIRLWSVLCFCGFLASDGISQQLLKNHLQRFMTGVSSSQLDIEFTQMMRNIQQYSLLQFEENISSIDHLPSLHMHRVIQKILRDNYYPKLVEVKKMTYDDFLQSLLASCLSTSASDESDLSDKLYVTLQPHIDSTLSYHHLLKISITLVFIQIKSILSLMQFKQGADNQALTTQEQVLMELNEYYPNEAEVKELVLIRQATILIELHRYLEAKTALETPILGITFDQHSLSWKETYANLLCHMHNQMEAETYITKLVSQIEDTHTAVQYRLQYQLAQLYVDTQEYEKAKHHIEFIIAHAPKQNKGLLAKCYLFLAKLYAFLDETSNNRLYAGDKAIEYGESAYAHDSIHIAEIYVEYAYILKNSLYRRRYVQVARTALSLLKVLSQKGLAKANYLLGLGYDREVFEDVSDKQLALDYYERAANADNASAQLKLVSAYSSDEYATVIRHIPKYQRIIKIFDLLEQAARLDFRAQFNLITMIERGEGPAHAWTIERRRERIFPLLHSAAMSGMAEAEAKLGQYFLNNKIPSSMILSETKKFNSALHWLLRAARQNHEMAKRLLALLRYKSPEKFPSDLVLPADLMNFMSVGSNYFFATVGYINGLIPTYDDFEPFTGYSELHHAAKAGELEICEYLLSHRVNVNAKNMQQETPLILAAEHGHFEIVSLLLSHRASTHVQGFRGVRALYFAVSQGRYNIFKALVDAGADIHYIDQYECTLLHHAVTGGHPDIIAYLLAHHININAQDGRGNTALYMAAFLGQREAYSQLMLNNANVTIINHLRDNCLHAVVNSGQVELVEIVSQHFIHCIDAVANGNITALCLAASAGNLAIFQMLIKVGATLPMAHEQDYSYLHAAATGGHPEILKIVLLTGVNIDIRSDQGLTALHQAAASGQFSTFKLLRENGADIMLRDNLNRTCLHHAALGGHPEIILDVLSAGIDVNAQADDGSSALHQTAKAGHLLAFQLLLAQGGADVDALNHEGWNCLHYAMADRHEEFSAYILKNRLVDQYKKTKKGESIEQLALNKSRYGGMQILRIVAQFGLGEKATADIEAAQQAKQTCLATLSECVAADHNQRSHDALFDLTISSEKNRYETFEQPLGALSCAASFFDAAEIEVNQAALHSQRMIHHIRIDDELQPSITVEISPDGNCGFSAVETALRIDDNNELAIATTRIGFINTVKRLVVELRNNTSETSRSIKLRGLLEPIYQHAHIAFNLDQENLSAWSTQFNKSSEWANDIHFALMSYLHNIRFEFYVVDHENNNQLSPRGGSMGDGSIIDHTDFSRGNVHVITLLHNSTTQVNLAATEPNNHFDLLFIDPTEELKSNIRKKGYIITQDSQELSSSCLNEIQKLSQTK